MRSHDRKERILNVCRANAIGGFELGIEHVLLESLEVKSQEEIYWWASSLCI